jgi:hypothetical protein
LLVIDYKKLVEDGGIVGFSIALCHIFGIDPAKCTEMTIHIAGGELPSVTIKKAILGSELQEQVLRCLDGNTRLFVREDGRD